MQPFGFTVVRYSCTYFSEKIKPQALSLFHGTANFTFNFQSNFG